MTKTITLFLPNDFHEELLYQYEGKDGDLRKLVFGFLTPLGKTGKMAKLNGSFQTQVMKYEKDKKVGIKAIQNIDLKDIDLEKYAVKSDSNWIPSKVTKEEIKIYKQSISNRLYDDLAVFGKLTCARTNIFNDTLSKEDVKDENIVVVMPVCFEQIIQDNVIGLLSQAVAGNIDSEYQEEFTEMEKKIEDKKPPKRNSKKE